MYHIEGFFVSNPANRFAIGNMTEQLHPDPDGVLTITIQRDSPGKAKDGNWRPAPAEGVVMRLSQPEERMYGGDYSCRRD